MMKRTRTTRRYGLGVSATAVVALMGLVGACGGGDTKGDGNGSGGSGSGAAAGIDCPVKALDKISKPVDIHIWHTQIGLPLKALESIAKKYNDSQDKVVVHFENQGTLDEQTKKFQDAMADPKSMPDIIMPDDTVTRFMADSGAVIPADSCIAADPEAKKIYDDMVPIIRASFSIDGTLWPGAFNAADAAFFYNESHFEKAGLDITNPPKTLAEVRAAAEKLKAANIPGLETPMVIKVNPWIVEFLISGTGQHMVNEDNGRKGLATKSLYDNEVSKEVYTWIRDMHRDGLLKVTDYTQDIDPFIAMAFQTSSMLIDTSSAISTVDAAIAGTLTPDQVGLKEGDIDLSTFSVGDLRIGVGELPGLEAAGKGQVGGTMWYLVDTGDDARIAAAWDFMKFFNQPENQVTWAVDGSSFPVSRTAAKDPKLQEAWTNTRVGQWMATAYKSFENLDPKNPGPVIGPYKEFRQSVRRGLEGMVFNNEEPDAVVKKVNDEFQGELDSYKADLKG